MGDGAIGSDHRDVRNADGGGPYWGPSGQLYQAVTAIPGWLAYVDAHVLWLANEWQRGLGIRGDILEIGAYQGQSAVVLGSFLADGETLEVCDVFDSTDLSPANVEENATQYSGLTRQSFEENYRERLGTLPIVHPVPSNMLGERLEGKAFRIVHVDGSHLYENVARDIELSRRVTLANGLVVLDDWSHSDHPEVAAAVWEVVLAGALIPAVTTDMKLYGMWGDAGGRELVDDFRRYVSARSELDVWSHDVGAATLTQARLKGWSRDASRRL